MSTHLSNTFSFSRLMMVMRRDLVENWKTNLQIALSVYGAFLISAVMSYTSQKDMTDSSLYFAYRMGFYMAVGIISYIIFLLNGVHIMETMNTKEKRISYLMLPATQAEKYVSRALQATVGTLVMILITLFLAELTRLMIFPILGAPEVLQQFCLFDLKDMALKGLFLNGVENIQLDYLRNLAILNTLSWSVFSLSIYILGGTYFYKRPFLKTFCLIILGFVTLGFICNYWEPTDLLKNVDIEIELWLSSILAIVLTGTCWGLSYFLFTRSQVTERINFKLFKRK